MLKALCFLGTGPQGGKYTPTTYVKHDSSKTSDETDLFPVAVSQLYNPEKIVVFVTPQVKEGDYLDPLKAKLGCKLEEKELPNLLDRGNSEEDLWQIFDTYQKSVDKNDKIILDITHGFRSLPMLAFPVVAYLRQVKQVTLEHILYAPYDARPESQENDTPIFDLTPFVDLLDWMNAVKIFQHSGDARPIAELRMPEGINNTDGISESLTNLSGALLTNLPLEAQRAAYTFNSLDTQQNEPSQAPFGMLIGSLQETYKDMAVAAPEENLNCSLESQYAQIRWYVKNQHYLQAITLIREWLVSLECQRANPNDPDWLNGQKRKNANSRLNKYTENYFGQLARQLTKKELHVNSEEFQDDCQNIRKQEAEKCLGIDLQLTVTKLWEDCKIVRNRLAHCGISDKTSDPETTPTFAEVSEEVKRLAEEVKHLQEIHKCFVGLQVCKKPSEIFRMQREQIEWYIEKQHYCHAATSIYECLIHWERFRDSSQSSKRNEAIIRLNNRKKKQLSGKLWHTCLDIRKKLSSLEKNFQVEEAQETVKKIKVLGSEDGLKKLLG